MPRHPNPVPTYRRHKPSGQAVVTVREADGTRKDIYLGVYDSPESRAEYTRVLQELAVAPVPATAPPATGTPPSGLTVNELLLAFWAHAQAHYRRPDGTPTSEIHSYRQAVRVTRELYGHTPVREFGPVALKAIRRRLIDAGLCRRVINGRVARIRHIFKWGMGEELVPAAVYTALTAVAGLQKGRTPAPDPEPVGPVAEEHVLAVLPFVRPPVRGMIQVQLLTGMRPAEVCQLRPRDIDTTGPVWVFRPTDHKTAHRGKPRAVAIGPRAQAVLAGFAPPDPGGYYFSPRQAVDALLAERAVGRKTTRWPSYVRRNERKRAKVTSRPAGRCYKPHSYAVAVARGCERAGVPHWHPNQLRHTFASGVRRRYGLEAAQVLLGHAKADVTQVYAERDHGLAVRVAAEIG
jgi:integrase